MNQDQLKESLDQLTDNRDFTVIYTGRESLKIGGLYNLETGEILIHNRNFSTDNQIMLEAIHQLSHHLLFLAENQTTQRHSARFYIIYQELIKKAVTLSLVEDDDSKFIQKAVQKGREHTIFLKEYGGILIELYDYCMKKHLSFGDMLHRKLNMTETEAKSLMSMYAVDIPEDLNGDFARKVSMIKKSKDRELAIESGVIKKAVAPKEPEEEVVFLAKELERLNKKIQKEQERVEEIRLLLEGLES